MPNGCSRLWRSSCWCLSWGSCERRRAEVNVDGAVPALAPPESFYCLAVGGETARECLKSKEACGGNACFTVEKAYCFSKNRLSANDQGQTEVRGRTNVCTPTLEECKAWSTGKTQPDPR